MYDTVWDQIAAWLGRHTAGQQIGIICAAVLAMITMFMWVTI